MGKKIAIVLGNLFNEDEYMKPKQAFEKDGHELHIIGSKAGQELKGENGTGTEKIYHAVTDVSASDFDALFIPGGVSPDKLRADDNIVAFTKAFIADNKPILAICHGPQLLITAEGVKGRTMTSWKTVQVDLKNAGANVKNEEVVVDGNYVTSRMPDDIPAFIEKSLELLK
ncbi:cysteine protease [Aneurinibacillus migulanus]|uniref:Cysteine protease n=1 Tax=Aneurinibacillus migulanus TaxID=47500 RepID=A0A0D1Y242_ANEMI|nr:type 1 glutamine amidotransferase domain-containing protein [Aneurinibacillus migulanus]KIV58393.1 cysteine protease [Aneurinibacillus migulanus]KIV59631.1 cysteine protease [Aneurinibacillus migulanus]KON90781.1 cysteine protease [Aneurinibacillus migulanus]KPD09894.1 cysteine protease [Aneurinibacillus migulanus]MCP1356551.1 type 1 glutamine amidotransferase [Aneurinibacillus migulanus]